METVKVGAVNPKQEIRGELTLGIVLKNFFIKKKKNFFIIKHMS